jgi:hypothetical protein
MEILSDFLKGSIMISVNNYVRYGTVHRYTVKYQAAQKQCRTPHPQI